MIEIDHWFRAPSHVPDAVDLLVFSVKPTLGNSHVPTSLRVRTSENFYSEFNLESGPDTVVSPEDGPLVLENYVRLSNYITLHGDPAGQTYDVDYLDENGDRVEVALSFKSKETRISDLEDFIPIAGPQGPQGPAGPSSPIVNSETRRLEDRIVQNQNASDTNYNTIVALVEYTDAGSGFYIYRE